jgi:hypothetical protein
MKPLNLAIVFGCLFIFYSCGKDDIAYNGTVYSKRMYPVPGVVVTFQYSKGDKKKSGGLLTATTDADGKFAVHETLKRNTVMEQVYVDCDSGHYDSGLNNRKGISDMKIVLE